MDIRRKARWDTINQQFRELTMIYRKGMVHSGASENEFWIWYTLVNSQDNCTQQDICEMWSLSKQTVNTIITNLAKKGYVTLEVIPGTRNRKNILLTQAGRAYGEELVSPICASEARAVERMSQEDLENCSRILVKFTQLLKEEIHGTEPV